MAMEAFLNSNTQSQMPMILPLNTSGGILEELTSYTSLKDEEDLHSILKAVHLNTNFGSNFMDSKLLRNSSTSRSSTPTGPYLRSLGNTNMETYVNRPSHPMPCTSHNSVNVFFGDDTISHGCQDREKERRKQCSGNTLGSTDIYKTEVQNRQDSLPCVKKRRIDVNQESNQQQTIQEVLLKELQDCNPQIKEMVEQYRQQAQLRGLHLQIPRQLVKTPNRSPLWAQGNQQEIIAPLLDGGICSRRFKQYLFHLRNNRHDNSISYWEKFVSEYYAPCSKKRWCFSKYENIEVHTAGVFCPRSMETWCCRICGSNSGKGLEATFEIFPRLFKIKYESGIVDDILFLDSPRTCKLACGVLLEYGKAIQESVYVTFRLVHKGKLRIIFRPDLKILSWEFCIENHDEFLLRTLFTPQVNQLVQAAEKYQDIQNYAISRTSSQDLRKVCDKFMSAGNQILRNMELPLVNDLGYPKRFIRCLQIGEVVDSMRDLMTQSRNTKTGPIECLNNYSQGSKSSLNGKQETKLFAGPHSNGRWMPGNSVISGSGNSGLVFINLDHHFLGPNSPVASPTKDGVPESCITGQDDRAIAFRQSFSSFLDSEEVCYGESSNGGSNFSEAGNLLAAVRELL